MISVKNLNHSFKIGKRGKRKRVPVLKGLTFDVAEGEIVSIVGKSGSGKSTLLHIMAGFLTPESGEILVKGVETSKFNEAEMRSLDSIITALSFRIFNSCLD